MNSGGGGVGDFFLLASHNSAVSSASSGALATLSLDLTQSMIPEPTCAPVEGFAPQISIHPA